MRIIHADWILVPDAAPLRDGAVLVEADGTVVRIGSARDVVADPRAAGLATERIHGVVFPGLVNAHVHVELSALRGKVRVGQGFVPWVKELIGARAAMDEDEERSAIETAVAALRAAGTVAVGEVTNGLGAIAPLARARIGGVAFHEVFSLDDGRARARIAAMPAERAERVPRWPASFRHAIAPHTLYTLGGAVVRDLAAAASADAPTSLHLAEHAGERRALERGEGPVVAWLGEQLKIDAAALPWPKVGPIAAAAALGALGPHVVLVHLTDATAEEITAVKVAGARVVLCPRSNLHIETKLPPVQTLRRAGVALALGTDSLASNASLDLLAEALAIHERFPEVPADELLTWATLGGARALGLSQLGTIAEGTRPGLVAVDGAIEGDPARWLLANLSRPRRILAEAWAEAA